MQVGADIRAVEVQNHVAPAPTVVARNTVIDVENTWAWPDRANGNQVTQTAQHYNGGVGATAGRNVAQDPRQTLRVGNFNHVARGAGDVAQMQDSQTAIIFSQLLANLQGTELRVHIRYQCP